LVPTPSVPDTRIGSSNPISLRSKSPPNPPKLASDPLRAVSLTNGLIIFMKEFPLIILTPESL